MTAEPPKKTTKKTGTTSEQRRFFWKIVLIILGSTLLLAAAAVVTFMVTLKSSEITQIPDVVGKDLDIAIIELQERGLETVLQRRISSIPGDKGKIIGQDPAPGSTLKVGSHVSLQVSKGAIIEEVKDYTGMTLDNVRNNLLSLASASGDFGEILTIGTIVQIWDEQPLGTVLQQSPLPGTKLNGNTVLDLWISKGPQGQVIEVLDYTDLDYTEVLRVVTARNIPFIFNLREGGEEQAPGTIMAQSIAPETEVPADTIMQFDMIAPEVPENFVFGVLSKTLQNYPAPVELKMEIIDPNGESSELFRMKHSGGAISIPYLVEDGSMLVISVNDQEIISEVIRKPEEVESDDTDA